MLASSALALMWLAASATDPQRSWVSQQDSFGHIVAFRVRADVHSQDEHASRMLKADVEEQISTTLRERGIRLTAAVPHAAASDETTADLIIDIHVADAEGSTAVAWSLHVSQFVRLATGDWAFAGTWIVGDLIVHPKNAIRKGLHDSLQPAVNELCAAHFSARERLPRKARQAEGAQL